MASSSGAGAWRATPLHLRRSCPSGLIAGSLCSLASVSLWHAWPALRAGRISPSLTNGLWLATIALGLPLIQLAVGAVLRYGSPVLSGLVRRIHFALMAAIGLLLAHIWLNSRFLYSLW